MFCADTPSGPIKRSYNVTKMSQKIGDKARFANAKTSFAQFFFLIQAFINQDSKLLEPIVCFAELVLNGLWAGQAE